MNRVAHLAVPALALAWCLMPPTAGFAAQTADGGRRAQVHPARRSPTTADFPTGPAIGERLPDFTLPNQRGEMIDFHADSAGHKAAVLFQRSAVW